MLKWLWLSGLIVALDQVTKQLAEQWLQPYQPLPVVPGFNLTLVYNPGAAFSFLSDAGGWQRWFFTLFAAIVVVVLSIWMKRLPREQILSATSLALIIGGAIGNVIDRVIYGHVIDFIDLYVGTWHWPAFNVADSAITVGVVLLLVDSWRGMRSTD